MVAFSASGASPTNLTLGKLASSVSGATEIGGTYQTENGSSSLSPGFTPQMVRRYYQLEYTTGPSTQNGTSVTSLAVAPVGLAPTITTGTPQTACNHYYNDVIKQTAKMPTPDQNAYDYLPSPDLGLLAGGQDLLVSLSPSNTGTNDPNYPYLLSAITNDYNHLDAPISDFICQVRNSVWYADQKPGQNVKVDFTFDHEPENSSHIGYGLGGISATSPRSAMYQATGSAFISAWNRITSLTGWVGYSGSFGYGPVLLSGTYNNSSTLTDFTGISSTSTTPSLNNVSFMGVDGYQSQGYVNGNMQACWSNAAPAPTSDPVDTVSDTANTPADLFGNADATAHDMGKPLVIAEWGSVPYQVGSADSHDPFVKEMAQFLSETNAALQGSSPTSASVAAALYFDDLSPTDPYCNWPISSSDSAAVSDLAAMSAGTSVYLGSSASSSGPVAAGTQVEYSVSATDYPNPPVVNWYESTNQGQTWNGVQSTQTNTSTPGLETSVLDVVAEGLNNGAEFKAEVGTSSNPQGTTPVYTLDVTLSIDSTSSACTNGQNILTLAGNGLTNVTGVTVGGTAIPIQSESNTSVSAVLPEYLGTTQTTAPINVTADDIFGNPVTVTLPSGAVVTEQPPNQATC